MRKIAATIRNLFRRDRVDRDLEAEVRSYSDLLQEEKMSNGMNSNDARRSARMSMGGPEQLKEEIRSARAGAWLETLWQDIRFGARMLRKNPAFAATAILTLALGIGATTAIFSVVDNVVFKPLPFPTSDRLVRVASVIAATGNGGVASYPDFSDWRARNHVFDGMAAFHTDDFTLIGPHDAQHLHGAVISAQMFSLLGVAPFLGRNFLPTEDAPNPTTGANPIILGYALWQRDFDSDAAVLGRTVQLGKQLFTVVGVMPRSIQFPIEAEPVELWTTVVVDTAGGANALTVQRGAHYLDVVAVLKPGVKLQQAQSELASIATALNKEHPENKARTVRIVPEIEGLIGPLRSPLLVLLGAVGCVLLIVCVNVANLLLARATGRQKEMALRTALGASHGRAIRQVLTESLALGLLGGGIGVALTAVLLKLLVPLIPADVPRLSSIGLDVHVLVFALLISLLAGILFGIVPALRISRIRLTESLNEGGRGPGGGGREHTRLRATLVVSEVALAVVLLLGTGLLIQSFLHLTGVDPGFNSSHVLTFELDSPVSVSDARLPIFFRNVVKHIGALPGVTSASAVASLPLTGDNISSAVEIEGQPTAIGSRPTANFNSAEPDYFHTVGISLIAGRDFAEQDNLKSTPVAIVNRRLAERFFPNQNPIGKRIRPGVGNGYAAGEAPMREIVGIVGDAKQSGLGLDAAPEVYAPLAQSPFGTLFIVVRTANDPRGLIAAVGSVVASVDKHAPVYHVETLDQYFAHSIAVPRFITFLLGGFAGLALVLACLGIYGVVSYVVVQRSHEIGVRVALGAQHGDILRLVIGEGLRPAIVGLVIGIACALKLTHILASMLYGVKPGDPLTFFGASMILIAVAMLACYIPARRATHVDPLVALRHE